MRFAYISENKYFDQVAEVIRRTSSEVLVDVEGISYLSSSELFEKVRSTGCFFEALVIDVSLWKAETFSTYHSFFAGKDPIVILVYDQRYRYDPRQIVHMKPLEVVPKPLSMGDLREIISKTYEQYLQEKPKMLEVKGFGKRYEILYEDIYLIESYKKVLSVHVTWKQEPIKYYECFRKVEDKLKQFGFYCIRRGCLVNTGFVREVDYEERFAVLNNGTKLDISRERAQGFIEFHLKKR